MGGKERNGGTNFEVPRGMVNEKNGGEKRN